MRSDINLPPALVTPNLLAETRVNVVRARQQLEALREVRESLRPPRRVIAPVPAMNRHSEQTRSAAGRERRAAGVSD
jgi:hypothetical protein